ncbi:MAG: sulfotransferase [Gemmataceae bacterium]
MPDAAKKPRDWSPRLWEGSDFFAWLKLLTRNRFAVEWPYLYIAGIVSAKSFLNTGLKWCQERQYADQLRHVTPPAPLFVLGHWRTGTTLLHELLIRDPQFTYPTSQHCLEPCHFLLSEAFYRKYLGFLLPGKRPMDNMPFGWDNPQEDEFALCLLGEPSTYTDVAFPNRPALHPGSLDLSGLSPKELAKWKRTLLRFVKLEAIRDPRPLVLKSPPHTARIPELLELFPDARFVHIKRDPYTLFASTVNLWTAMGRKHGFQTPRNRPAVEAKVFREFRVVYERFLATKEMIPTGRFVEVKYEELVTDLVGGVERVYAGLGLPGFEAARPGLERYVAASKGYETNKYTLTDDQRRQIADRWGDLIAKLDYV